MIRAELISAFLSKNGLGTATRSPLAGDASARRYERITKPSDRFILMDDASGNLPAINAFVSIATHLRGLGLSAPEIFAHDLPNGFVLMEDLGDAVFAREIAQDARRERPLYSAAIALFGPLHAAAPPPNTPAFDARIMANATDVAFQWYQNDVRDEIGLEARHAMEVLQSALQAVALPPVLALRDFHAENLIWLPERTGHARVGLLDFQDAVLTHPIYDLVSLIRDARRDVSPDVAQMLLSQYATLTRQNMDEVSHSAAVISIQRNLRILGVFARLSRQMDKPSYVDLIPRVWRMLQEDLNHPELQPLAENLRPLLPPPTDDFLDRLRMPCPMPS